MKKELVFKRNHDGIPASISVSSYHPTGLIQTWDADMHMLIDKDRERLNKMLEEFFKIAEFKD